MRKQRTKSGYVVTVTGSRLKGIVLTKFALNPVVTWAGTFRESSTCEGPAMCSELVSQIGQNRLKKSI